MNETLDPLSTFAIFPEPAMPTPFAHFNQLTNKLLINSRCYSEVPQLNLALLIFIPADLLESCLPSL